MKKLILLATVSLFFAIFTSQAAAQSSQRVRFPAGSHGTTVLGTVRGYTYRDYIVNVRGGQTITLRLTATAQPSVFTVFLPGGANLDGAAESDEFTGVLPRGGDYVIRVGMMRSEARRKNSVSNYKLKITVR